ncbi:hypothetical protein HMPREF1564_3839 [Providencia alcalifaciens R90-1475]|nr:hypothetical protein HMPREF1564_3839 [Providencia alcalifaciens R90-1475]
MLSITVIKNATVYKNREIHIKTLKVGAYICYEALFPKILEYKNDVVIV